MSLLDIDKKNLPRHVAVIMDGNGRWAKKNGQRREYGHRAGRKAVKIIVESCVELKIKNLTLYAFSTENWNRAAHEVEALMRIFRGYLQTKFLALVDNNVRVKFLGDPSPIAADIALQMKKLENATCCNTGLYLNIAVNYGGRDEIIRAVKGMLKASANSDFDIDKIDEQTFESFLDTSGQSDPDLIIRTAGELRLSNFLTWQSSYSEFYFTELTWPEFYSKDLSKALLEYSQRHRKFGKETTSIFRRNKF